MGNVARVLMRDVMRLLKAPAALIVVGALLVLPSIYTWYNVAAFWSPYTSTGGMQVCVVNQDEGAESDMTGPLNVGSRIAEELLANEQLKWSQEDYDQAMDDLKAGNVYAVYVIPPDFTECLLSPLSGQVKHPNLRYYVNEKLGPVSPKITDNASSRIDETINSMFVETVSDVAVNAIDTAAKEAEEDVAASRSQLTSRMDDARSAVAQVHDAIAGIQDASGEAKLKAQAASDALVSADSLVNDSQAVLQDMAIEATEVQEGLSQMSSQVVPALSDVLATASQVTGQASTAADGLMASANSAQTQAGMAVAQAQPVADALKDLADDLRKFADDLPDDSEVGGRLVDAAADAQQRADQLQGLIDDADAIDVRISDAIQEADDSAHALEGASQQISESFEGYANGLFSTTAPAINSSLAQVGASCTRLSSSVDGLHTVIQEAQVGLGQLGDVLDSCADVALQTGGLMSDVQQDIDSVMADARLLEQSDAIADLVRNGTLNSQSISEFMGAPTQLVTSRLYPVNAYGTAMSPLFMNLTFWIGAFMLVIIFRLEVDSEGMKNLKPWQRYLSRFIMFCSYVVMQGIICCAGTLALGVQASNVPALFVAAAVTALAYLSIIYALSVTFRHIGQGLCIVLVFAQIPGGSGLYPIELTSSFFQAIYPFLPFSYGIDAIREAIGGFYGGYYARDLVVLGVYFIGALVVGLIGSSLMSNVIRMTSKQIKESDLYNGEDAMAPERPYRLSQVLRALTDRDDYREELERRYARFSRRYPLFIRASIVLGVSVPVVLALMLALSSAAKVVLLTIFLVWLVGLFVFLVIMESQRYSFERQLNIDKMSDERLLRFFSRRDHMVPASEEVLESDSDPDQPDDGAAVPVDDGRHAGNAAESGADDE